MIFNFDVKGRPLKINRLRVIQEKRILAGIFPKLPAKLKPDLWGLLTR